MAHAAATTAESHDHDAHESHAVPFWLLMLIFVALLFLTFITVAATWVDLGSTGNLTLAMVIALIKAALVGLFFMHLLWDSPLNGFILIASLAFVVLFIAIAGMDKGEYAENRGEKVQDIRRAKIVAIIEKAT